MLPGVITRGSQAACKVGCISGRALCIARSQCCCLHVRAPHAGHQRRPTLCDIGAPLQQALGQLEPERAAEWGAFLDAYRARLRAEGMPLAERRALQDGANPCYIPRNALMQDAIRAAEAGSFDEVRVPLSVILGEKRGGLNQGC